MTRTLILVVVRVLVAIAGYGALIFLGAWIDGRRQAVREKGLHPVQNRTAAWKRGSMPTKTKRHKLSEGHGFSRALGRGNSWRL